MNTKFKSHTTLTEAQAGVYLGLGPGRLSELRSHGKSPVYFGVEWHTLRYERKVLDAFIEQHDLPETDLSGHYITENDVTALTGYSKEDLCYFRLLGFVPPYDTILNWTFVKDKYLYKKKDITALLAKKINFNILFSNYITERDTRRFMDFTPQELKKFKIGSLALPDNIKLPFVHFEGSCYYVKSHINHAITKQNTIENNIDFTVPLRDASKLLNIPVLTLRKGMRSHNGRLLKFIKNGNMIFYNVNDVERYYKAELRLLKQDNMHD